MEPDHGNGAGDVADLRLRIPAVTTELTALRHAMTDWANKTPLDPDQVEAVRLASYEAAANVVEHAYQHRGAGPLTLDAVCRPQLGTVTVSITDKGRWRPVRVDESSPRGRGLPIIHALTDDTQITAGPTGTTIRMHWNLGTS